MSVERSVPEPNLCLFCSNSQKHDSSIAVPPLSFVKDSLYQPVFIIPEPMEQRVFATEVRL